ncbi:beta-carotene hydroxylase [Sphingobacterium alkalisoli]|uniref:Beta-carotene hydroxylase n=1 Tax=Sphingobacterium alkalisoli TaxID=1874115 RepID=A0A4U0GUQ6_9SPHI|nr:sterol desaturase family protein [Sphingobacterium alkalisoli]TJY62753.1 beta-carotene hydroxylase [Sphingobacterium alkalisoli]GGH28672.1 beta-carotene hydroxylase [Sphingobacterium alkalisoli]
MSVLIVVVTFLLMEGFTWCTHKYIMHGFLWYLHKDHHDHDHEGKVEKNDYFFIIFAIPAFALMYYGSLQGFNYWFYIGLGITIYGFSYFFVHDIFIHQRIKLLRNTQNPYLLAIRRAHKQHHKHTGKREGECFGFLWVPIKYFKMYFKNKRA